MSRVSVGRLFISNLLNLIELPVVDKAKGCKLQLFQCFDTFHLDERSISSPFRIGNHRNFRSMHPVPGYWTRFPVVYNIRVRSDSVGEMLAVLRETARGTGSRVHMADPTLVRRLPKIRKPVIRYVGG